MLGIAIKPVLDDDLYLSAIIVIVLAIVLLGCKDGNDSIHSNFPSLYKIPVTTSEEYAAQPNAAIRSR